MSVLKIIKENKTPILAGVGGLAAYVAYRHFKKMAKLKKKKIVGGINVTDLANQIGDAYGVDYAFYDPRFWSENESEAIKLLQSIPITLIPEVEKEYTRIFERSLRTDSMKYLKEDYTKVSYLFRAADVKNLDEKTRILIEEFNKKMRSR
jgi:hypothetical protein